MNDKGNITTKDAEILAGFQGYNLDANHRLQQSKRYTWIAALVVTFIILTMLFITQRNAQFSSDILSKSVCGQNVAILHSPHKLPPRGCTIFTVAQGDNVYFGGNGDWINFDSNYYWVDPGNARSYGAIYFGKPENIQQGFNEMGLAYDSNGVSLAPITSHPGHKVVFGGYSSYPIHILRKCATVEEVITWVNGHQWHKMMHDQLHFADASGDAVVISAGADGKVVFTRKPVGDGFLISTNFNLANPDSGSYPCWRYDLAQKMLQDIDDENRITAEKAASVLNAVHVESANLWTILSLVGDLPNGLVYVYLFHQFDDPIVLNIADEIIRAPELSPIRDLFPYETLNKVDEAYQRLMIRSKRCDIMGFLWLGMVGASLTVIVFGERSGRRYLTFWVLVVAVLGPFGLLIWLIVTRIHPSDALVEIAGDLPPYVIGMVTAMMTLILLHNVGLNNLQQLLILLGVPLFISVFLVQTPILALETRGSYVHTLLQRVPTAIVSTNIILAGLQASALPLIKEHINYCGFSILAVLSWWALSSLSASGGGILLYVYHTWTTHRGFRSWSALLFGAENAGDEVPAVVYPSWRKSWTWAMVSFMILIAGMVIQAAL
jgi:hypothetical protein